MNSNQSLVHTCVSGLSFFGSRYVLAFSFYLTKQLLLLALVSENLPNDRLKHGSPALKK